MTCSSSVHTVNSREVRRARWGKCSMSHHCLRYPVVLRKCATTSEPRLFVRGAAAAIMVGRSNLGEVDTLQAGSLPRRSRNPREWPVRTPTFSADYPNDDFFPSARIRLPTGTGTNGSGHSRPESVLPVVSKVAIRVFVLAMAARFGRREGCRWPCRLSLLSFGEVSAYHTRFA